METLRQLLCLSGFGVQEELFLALYRENIMSLQSMKQLIQQRLTNDTECMDGFIMMVILYSQYVATCSCSS